MSQPSHRLIEQQMIPPSLWDPDQRVLSLPPELAAAFTTLIDRYSLRSLSENRDGNNPPVGGPSQESTDKHFAQAFDGSVARAELVLLDPLSQVTMASDALISALSGDTVVLTDAPCGAGAAAIGLLSTITELRAQEVLPRTPLDVRLIGAEISLPARKYAAELIEELRQSFEAQAIFVTERFSGWDVTDLISNTDLIQLMTLTSQGAARQLLVIANFNAFLERAGKRKDAQPQIEELFRHASGDNNVAVWVEPAMNRAVADGGLFNWLCGLVDNAWRRFATRNSDGSANKPVGSCAAEFRVPLRCQETARVSVAVMRIDLVRRRG